MTELIENDVLEIVSRGEARSFGWDKYFTGKPCRNQHVAPRKTHNGDCVECATSWSRQYRADNPLKMSKRHKIYFESNKDVFSVRRQRRRARLVAAEGLYTIEDLRKIRRQQSGYCNGCGVDLAGVVEHNDHILPLSRGGSNWPSNIQILCGSCNLSKHDKTMEEWILKKSK